MPYLKNEILSWNLLKTSNIDCRAFVGKMFYTSKLQQVMLKKCWV